MQYMRYTAVAQRWLRGTGKFIGLTFRVKKLVMLQRYFHAQLDSWGEQLRGGPCFSGRVEEGEG